MAKKPKIKKKISIKKLNEADFKTLIFNAQKLYQTKCEQKNLAYQDPDPILTKVTNRHICFSNRDGHLATVYCYIVNPIFEQGLKMICILGKNSKQIQKKSIRTYKSILL